MDEDILKIKGIQTISNFQVKEVYFILNNQRLYATKYNNFNEMKDFLIKANDSFAGYSIEELKNVYNNNYKILMLAYRAKSDKSFGVHYTITGIINNSFGVMSILSF